MYVNSRAHLYTVTWFDIIGICILKWKLEVMTTQSDPYDKSIYSIIFGQYRVCIHQILLDKLLEKPEPLIFTYIDALPFIPIRTSAAVFRPLLKKCADAETSSIFPTFGFFFNIFKKWRFWFWNLWRLYRK